MYGERGHEPCPEDIRRRAQDFKRHEPLSTPLTCPLWSAWHGLTLVARGNAQSNVKRPAALDQRATGQSHRRQRLRSALI